MLPFRAAQGGTRSALRRPPALLPRMPQRRPQRCQPMVHPSEAALMPLRMFMVPTSPTGCKEVTSASEPKLGCAFCRGDVYQLERTLGYTRSNEGSRRVHGSLVCNRPLRCNLTMCQSAG